jgi:aminopeptidase N
LLILFFCLCGNIVAQPLSQRDKLTRQDTLRGTITKERSWWDVTHYAIQVAPDFATKTIQGTVIISFGITRDGKHGKMQIDLQQPMKIDSILFNNSRIRSYKRDGNVYFIDFGEYNFTVPRSLIKMKAPVTQHRLKIYFHGKPREAIDPPWDGGWIWRKDQKGRPWMTVACQGLGASVWYPCKDHQSDEPDEGASIEIKVKNGLTAVANGRLQSKTTVKGFTGFKWAVKNPINNYNIVPYIGHYVNWKDNFQGEKGNLSIDYWVLDYNLAKSKKQFNRDVKPMLSCFENWFGPFPFYEDGFKLVESSHLGMEHQSGIAYGNNYVNGYMGSDLSGSGWGKNWDYIIVHESGHEWFGNNITTRDIADMWVHEGFTDYSETVFVECLYGKEAANAYTTGLRAKIVNDIPVIGLYGVNKEGSDDMYYKGNNLIHMIRQIINDDNNFRNILRGLNSEFYHKTIDSKNIEDYIIKQSGKDLAPVFDQYLRDTRIPVLEYEFTGDNMSYRWTNCIASFNMPVRITPSGAWLSPLTEWKQVAVTKDILTEGLKVDKNFYIEVRKAN